MMVKRSFHTLQVDGQDVVLRIFIPEKSKSKKPAVFMVCGLLWLGSGLMGRIGLAFNDAMGFSWARAGAPCVQIHTPVRHMAHTRMLDLLCVFLWPLTMMPFVCSATAVLDALLLATSIVDLCFLLLVPILPRCIPRMLVLPVFHLLIRLSQWLQGAIPWPKHRSASREIAAASEWVRSNSKELDSDGRVVLAGYSSGGHCASMHALAPGAPRYEAVVLISGLYNLQTELWTGGRRFLAPVMNLLYNDAYGAGDEAARRAASPCAVVPKTVEGDWYVTAAKNELFGLEPFQDILFSPTALCSALQAAGAKVHRVTCGSNHWSLNFAVVDFFDSFVKSLVGAPDSTASKGRRSWQVVLDMLSSARLVLAADISYYLG